MFIEYYPFLYLCSTSEMLYIIEHRLLAQKIDNFKSSKVINDIILRIFNHQSIDVVFSCKNFVSLEQLRETIDQIAHCSIMKLSEESMSKLFDLIIMALKYQLIFAQNSLDLFDIVGNHLDSIELICQECSLVNMISAAKNKFYDYFSVHTIYRLHAIRSTLLTYFNGYNIKVSALIKMGVQDNDGNFILKEENVVACYCQIPGSISYLKEEQITGSIEFNPQAIYKQSTIKTTLGLNIYAIENSIESGKSDKEKMDKNGRRTFDDEKYADEMKENAKKSAHLLANLIGKNDIQLSQNAEVNLFIDYDEKENTLSSSSSCLSMVKENNSFSKKVELDESESRLSLLKIREELHFDSQDADDDNLLTWVELKD